MNIASDVLPKNQSDYLIPPWQMKDYLDPAPVWIEWAQRLVVCQALAARRFLVTVRTSHPLTSAFMLHEASLFTA